MHDITGVYYSAIASLLKNRRYSQLKVTLTVQGAYITDWR